MIVVGVIAFGLADYIASRNASATVLLAGRDRLMAVAESRAAEIKAELEAAQADIVSKYNNPVILSAGRAFVRGWDIAGPEPAAQLRDELALAPASHGQASRPPSAYALVHQRYHPFFQSRTKAREYGDIYLLNARGTVIYSVMKGAAFGENVTTGQITNSGLAEAYQSALANRGKPDGTFIDFKPYAPDGGALSAFLSIPVESPQGTLEAVLVIRVPATRLSRVMARPEGLGSSGQAFVLGKDGKLRTEFAPSRRPILSMGAEEAAPNAATFQSQSGVWRHGDATGRTVLTAVVPIAFKGLTFAVAAQQDTVEILMPAVALRAEMLRDGSWALALVSALGLLLARSITVPLTGVGAAMGFVASGDFGKPIPARERGDEIGDIARRLDAFRASLIAADGLVRENAFKSAAFQASSAAMMLVDKDLTILFVNAQLVDLMTTHRIALERNTKEFDPAALLGRNLTSLYPAASRARDVLRTERHHSDELQLGHARLKLALAPIHGDDGATLGYVVEWQDVTESRLSKVVLAAIDAQLPIAGFSPDGRVLDANRLFLEWADADGGVLTGRHWNQIFVGAEAPGSASWAQVCDKSVARIALTLQSQRDNTRTLACFLCRVEAEDGRLQRFVLLATNRGENRSCHALPADTAPHALSAAS